MNMKIVTFSDTRTNVKIKKRGYLIGENLAITPANKEKTLWEIFNVKTGKLAIKAEFRCVNQLTSLANEMSKMYADYWPILEVEPGVNIPLVTRYTVPNGLKMYEKIQQYEEQGIVDAG